MLALSKHGCTCGGESESADHRVACALVNDDSSSEGGAEAKAAPPIAYTGGAARRVSAALLGASSSSHAQKPPTNKSEGDAKEENVGAMHVRELRANLLNVKEREARVRAERTRHRRGLLRAQASSSLLTKVKISLGCRSNGILD